MSRSVTILHESVLSQYIEENNVCAVNDKVFASLLKAITKEDFAKIAQPHMVIGEAGSGKTFLLKRFAHSIETDMQDLLYPIILEGKSLFSTDDIWRQCISCMNIESGDSNLFDDILVWQEKNLRRIVLLIDNIQYYFNRTNNSEQFRLRGNLNRAGSPILIATSEQVLPAYTEYNSAFFDGFKILYLRPITLDVIEEILKGKYDISRLERIIAYMPKTIRSMYTAMDIIDKSKNIETDLDILTDYYSPVYQSKYDASLIQVQRILSALSNSDIGLSLQGIRKTTGQGSEKISPYLKMMINQNLIIKTSKTQRGGIYSIKDPLFKIWLQHYVS